MYELKTIKEVIFSVGDMEKVLDFFVTYGGWDIIGKYQSSRSVLDFWGQPQEVSTDEVLINAYDHPTGWIRLVKYHGAEDQRFARSSQKPWDVGGIMDINLRVHDVQETFDYMREHGWHGLSDPLFQTMGPFALYDVLMNGFDDIIVAFTHRKQPPLELPDGLKIPSHIYNSSITVGDLAEAQNFYVDKLGFKLLNEYSVKKDKPQENMFGMPFNLADQIDVQANIISLDGERDVVFQIIKYVGLEGKDHRATTMPPHRGLVAYRCAIQNVGNYYEDLKNKGVEIHREMTNLSIEPYGEVPCFAVVSPNGVLWEFYEG